MRRLPVLADARAAFGQRVLRTTRRSGNGSSCEQWLGGNYEFGKQIVMSGLHGQAYGMERMLADKLQYLGSCVIGHHEIGIVLFHH